MDKLISLNKWKNLPQIGQEIYIKGFPLNKQEPYLKFVTSGKVTITEIAIDEQLFTGQDNKFYITTSVSTEGILEWNQVIEDHNDIVKITNPFMFKKYEKPAHILGLKKVFSN